jgi:hypothetical protein
VNNRANEKRTTEQQNNNQNTTKCRIALHDTIHQSLDCITISSQTAKKKKKKKKKDEKKKWPLGTQRPAHAENGTPSVRR